MVNLVTDNYYEVFSCLRSEPECLKSRETCLGRCGGSAVEVRQDFYTMISKKELSDTVLSIDNGWARSRANCTTKTAVVEVPLFEGGDALRAFASHLRVVSRPLKHWHDSVLTTVLPAAALRLYGGGSTHLHALPYGLRCDPAGDRARAHACVGERRVSPLI